MNKKKTVPNIVYRQINVSIQPPHATIIKVFVNDICKCDQFESATEIDRQRI